MTTKRIGVAFVLGLAIVLAMSSIAIARPATTADDEAGMHNALRYGLGFHEKYRQQLASEEFDQAHTPPPVAPTAPFTVKYRQQIASEEFDRAHTLPPVAPVTPGPAHGL